MKNVNDWLLKRPGSDIVILSANTENHFNNCVRGGVPKMVLDGFGGDYWIRRKRTMMDILNLRVIIKMTKTRLYHDQVGLATSIDGTSSFITLVPRFD